MAEQAVLGEPMDVQGDAEMEGTKEENCWKQ